MQTALPKLQYDYQIISTIRIFAICSIIWGHCAFGIQTAAFRNNYDPVFQSLGLQLGKMGTILFFIISGFLIRNKLNTYTVFGFLKHRFSTTILPWIIFVLLLVTLIILDDKPLKSIILQGTVSEILTMLYHVILNVISYHSYWFIAVFIITMIALILFKKYISSPKMGLVLALLTLYYTVNLYHGWTSVHHTRAFAGYIFFSWVGIHISKHYVLFTTWLKKTPWTILLPVLTLTIAIACREGYNLTKVACGDPYASIRLSNIIATLVLFICLFKAGKVRIINRFIPDQIVYGIYLVHNILLYEQTMLIKTYLHYDFLNHSTLFLLSMQLLNFFFILFTSMILVKAFYNRKHIITRLIKILTSNRITPVKVAFPDKLQRNMKFN
jgi:fucose 4-O-acetylase-like acetyltransferase